MHEKAPPRDDDVRPEGVIKALKTEPEDKGLKDIPVTPANYRKFEGETPHASVPKAVYWAAGALGALLVAGFFVSASIVKGRITGSLAENLGTLRAGVEDLQNLDPESASHEFSSLKNPATDLGSFMNIAGFLFKGGADAIGAFSELSGRLTDLSGELASLQAGVFDLMTTGKGDMFIAQLDGIRTTIDAIDAASAKLSDASAFAGGFSALGSGDFYMSLKSQMESSRRFLAAFIPWFSDPAPHHVLVLLDNPSELRPGGGFLGSYADVTIASGSIQNIAVHDIADADLAFTKKIIPPKPLQAIVAKWRPADANWFFDFPTTASKTISFFEATSLYANTSTTFDAAIAVSPRVVSDLLGVTGPITIGKPSTTFTAGNFLEQVQKIVQNGQATDATYPKQVLRDLSGAIFARLASSTPDDRQTLLATMLDWIGKKDVMVYFKDPDLERFAREYGASGAVYDLPQKFNGDYLAVVDANVGGGKSDLYVSSTVTYSTQINGDGTLSSHVAVTRKHLGNKSQYWWYKTPMQDYLQLFLIDPSTPTNASGGIAKKIAAPTNYMKGGYLTDPLVTAIEGTEETIFGYPTIAWHLDEGKRVVTTWLTAKPGATASFSFDYSHRLFLPPAEGVEYQFVFERQAGASQHYEIDINAPLGYAFKENGIASYSYVTDDIPGRLVVDLTLTKLAQ